MLSELELPSDARLPHMTIHGLLQARAQLTPNATAILAPGQGHVTYKRLLNQIDGSVETLNGIGIGRNDRVAMVLPNGPEAAMAFLSVAVAATCAPLNPTYQANEFDFYLSDLNAKALIVQSGIDSPAIAVAQKRGIPVIRLTPAPGAEAGIFTLTCDIRLRPVSPERALADRVALLLYTSGTTSTSKLVALTQKNICRSALQIGASLNLEASDRCLNVMPLFHIHGLIGAVLSSLVAGSSVVCTRGFDPQQFFCWLREFRPSWYTAVPTIHQMVLSQVRSDKNTVIHSSLRFMRSASAALPKQVMRQLEEIFHVPVIEAYGMTEASHQISSNPLPPGKRKTGSVGLAAGPDVAIMDEFGNLLASGQVGEIVIRGASVIRGYEDNPLANQTAFSTGWLRTGDQGYLDEDGYLFITGRLKEMINRGGEKISPLEIEEIFMEHPAIAQAVTFAIPDSQLGEDVATAVVLRENASATDIELQEFASKRLAYFKIPRHVIFLNEISKGPTGKLQRIGLAEKLSLKIPDQPAVRAKAPYVAPRTPAEMKLASIWAVSLGLPLVGVCDNFFDLGGTSLLAATLLVRVERSFGKKLPLASLFLAPTIERQASLLSKDTQPLTWSSLVPLKPYGSKPPFFWVHGDDSNAFLPLYLDENQPLYGLTHQSQDGNAARYTAVEDIATYYLAEIRSVQPQGPYFLGGYCFGGVVIFEIARQLQMQGQEIALLVLLNPPSLGPPISHQTLRETESLTDAARRHLHNLALLRPQERFIYVLERVKTKLKDRANNIMVITKILKDVACKLYLGLGWRLPISLRSRYILKIYQQAKLNYVPEVYPGRLIMFKAAEGCPDPKTWEKLAAGGVEIHDIPGNHTDIVKEPYMRVWAEQLKVLLQRAQQTTSSTEMNLALSPVFTHIFER